MLIKLQGYVLREVIKILLLAIIGVSAMILLTLCVRLMREGLKPVQLQGIIVYLFPFTLPFAVPCGMLIASVMSFGRLAGDNELLAIRSSGINLWSVVWPVAVLGLTLTVGAELLDNNVLPWCQKKVADKRNELIGPWLEMLGGSASPITLPPYEVHIGSVNPDHPKIWRSVVAVKYADEFVAQLIVAKRGTSSYDERTQTGVMILTDGYMITPLASGQESYVSFPNNMSYKIDMSTTKDISPPKNAQLTLGALLERRAEIMRNMKGAEVGSRLRVELHELEKSVDANDKALRQLLARQRQLASELGGINTEFDRLNAQKATLEASRKTAEDDLAGKKALLALQEQNMAEIKRTMESLPANSARRRELNLQLSAAGTKRAEMQKALAEQENKVTQSAGELTRVADAIAKNRASFEQATKNKALADAGVTAANLVKRKLGDRMEQIENEENLRAVNAQIHFRVAQGVACFVFALLGIPLGIMARRGGVMVPFGISFGVIICLYYPIYTMGRQMSESGLLPAYVAMWLPNAVCGVLGVVLLIRTLRR